MRTDKADILALLRSSEGYVSGQQMCEQFGVSRTAVWKVINQLKEEGYTIESVTRRGYRLLASPRDILSASEIASRLTTSWVGRKLYYFESTGSTNTDAKRYADAGDPHGTTVVADMQTEGKGRRGRKWQSPAGTTVSFTIVLKPTFSPDKASMITLIAAISVAQAIEEICHVEAKIKWPNDIVVNRKKVCGMLTEMSMTPEMDDIQHIVVGIGINVNNESTADFSEEIRETASSLRIETGKKINRAELVERTLAHFEQNYGLFEQSLDLTALKEVYQEHLINLNEKVRVLDPAGEYTGVAKGITKTGELVVEREDGQTVNVYAGEVSVRGLYGYT